MVIVIQEKPAFSCMETAQQRRRLILLSASSATLYKVVLVVLLKPSVSPSNSMRIPVSFGTLHQRRQLRRQVKVGRYAIKIHALLGEYDELRLSDDTMLSLDIVAVGRHRGLDHSKLRCDLRSRHSPGEIFHTLQFGWGGPFYVGREHLGFIRPDLISLNHFIDRAQDFLDRRALHHIAACTGLFLTAARIPPAHRAAHKHFYLRMFLVKLRGQIDSGGIATGQSDVQINTRSRAGRHA